ncbi:hypothetical protein BDV29DRAFT_139059 [Aspergillus leporis]|uniref:Uncharacterized protein n=1 Tax=Aspergillus leporis TaxID=41062 RepID=A0A5N5WZR9_9EURO|nr:hypothetical protein BDV29DRAFT_139059 [Aspergillus leporis]
MSNHPFLRHCLFSIRKLSLSLSLSLFLFSLLFLLKSLRFNRDWYLRHSGRSCPCAGCEGTFSRLLSLVSAVLELVRR